MGLEGRDYADRCHAPNLGILAVRFEVDDLDAALHTLRTRGGAPGRVMRSVLVPPYGRLGMAELRTPDGAIVQLMERR
jgi:predicted enzyme related to lactoylglutathione lyase